MMKLHSFGTAVNCGQCGQPSKTLYAETSHAAINLGQGVCPACYRAQAVPLQVEHTGRSGRRQSRHSLVDMVEAERERELMRGRLTGATMEPGAHERAETVTGEVEGNGSEGGSV